MKRSSSKMKKVLSISFAVLFVVSLTAMSASARPGWYRGGPWGGGGSWGDGFGGGIHPYWGYGPGCMWVGGNNWLCPAYSWNAIYHSNYSTCRARKSSRSKSKSCRSNSISRNSIKRSRNKTSYINTSTSRLISSPSSPTSGDVGTSYFLSRLI